jgi:hypothetical protein
MATAFEMKSTRIAPDLFEQRTANVILEAVPGMSRRTFGLRKPRPGVIGDAYEYLISQYAPVRGKSFKKGHQVLGHYRELVGGSGKFSG